ncbi:MAG: hypothetical protein ACI9UJ_001924 [bacterium]
MNRLDNSKKMPIHWSYDKLRYGPITFRKYVAKYRLDAWYNAIDGAKVGGKFSGNYFNFKHIIDARVLYNTGFNFSETDETLVENRDAFSYEVNYRTKVANHTNLMLSSKWMAGWMYHTVGVNKQTNKGSLQLDFASADRKNRSYLLYPEFANTGIDNWVTLGYTRNYKQFNGGGSLELKTQAPIIFSDYAYASVSAELKNNQRIKKMVLRTRAFAQYLSGSNIAPEAMLQLSGANTYQLMDNRYSRAVGWLSNDQLVHSRDGNNVHQGGGLNLRGYSGVAATNIHSGDTFFSYAGTSGVAINAELDFGNYINPKLGKIGRVVQINPYLFTDLGILGVRDDLTSGLRVDAGVGANFALQFNRKFSSMKPLNIRIDLPVFLNRIPEEQTEYVQMRYVFGINRAF